MSHKIASRFFTSIVGGISRLIGTGTLAPTQSVTGFGASPTILAAQNSSDFAGVFSITAGVAPAATGTVVVTFSSSYGGFAPVCFATLQDNSGAWNGRATIRVTSIFTTSVTFTWDNNAVALVAGSTYQIAYMCVGRSA